MRLLNYIQKYLSLWVALTIGAALSVGYTFPGIAVLKLAIPFLLFAMLYPMMIQLRMEDIVKAGRNLKLVGVAVFMNFLVTPLLGAIWTHFLFRHADPYLAVGFILKITVPCSGMVAAWTGYARGKVESALIVVALSFILAIFMVPFWMWALAGVYVPIDPWVILKKMGLVVILPMAAGMITRKGLIRCYGSQRYRADIVPFFPLISTCAMLLMLFTIISSQAPLILDNFQWMLLIIFGIGTLYPIVFGITLILARLTRVGYGDGIALGYSTTAKNHVITIGLATTAFAGTAAVLPAAVAPVIQIPIMIVILRNRDRFQRFLSPKEDFSKAKPPPDIDSG
jgi:ACR3 family arsenite transporter